MRRINSILIFAMATLCPWWPVYAQHLSDSLDREVARIMAERNIPGLALAVVKDGIPVKMKGYGWADVENNVPVHIETIFQSGSIGKQFTATAIMLLQEDGKLNIDDPISRYFANAPPSWAPMTIRHLLTHTSGIPDIPEDSTGIDLQEDYTEEELTQIAMTLPLNFYPGNEWDYSNTGYILLGIIVRKASGKFYGDFLEERVFAPLYLETIQVINEQNIIKHRSRGYLLHEGEWQNQTWVSRAMNTTADGSLYLTIADLVKWEEAVRNGKLLKPESWKAMLTPVKLNNDSLFMYGFGWFLDSINGHRSYYHGGSWQGYNSFIASYPEDQLSLILLTNLSPCFPDLVAQDLAAVYVPSLRRKKYEVKAIDENKEVSSWVRTLVNSPEKVDSMSVWVEDSFRKRVGSYQQRYAGYAGLFGPVADFKQVTVQKQTHTLSYAAKYKAGSRLVTVTLNDKGQIINIMSEPY